MNKVYKLVWSKAKNCYVVASEFAKRHTKEQSGKLNRVGSMALTSCLMVTLLFVGGTEMAYATNQVGSGNGISFSANADAGVDPKNIALGDDSKITGSVAIAIGHKAKAEEHQSIAIGAKARTQSANSISIGTEAEVTPADGDYSHAMGYKTRAKGSGVIAIGKEALGYASSTVTLGNGAKGYSTDGIAIGHDARSGKSGVDDIDNAIAIGNKSIAEGLSSVAVGNNSRATKVGATAFGNSTRALAKESTAIGNNSYSDSRFSFSMGQEAVTGGFRSAALGSSAWANGKESVAVGSNAKVGIIKVKREDPTNDKQITGYESKLTVDYAVAVGYLAASYSNGSVAIGESSTSGTATEPRSTHAVAIGGGVSAYAKNSIAIGSAGAWESTEKPDRSKTTLANKENAIAIGTGNVVTGARSGAIGDLTTITGRGTYSLGNNNGTIAANETGVFGNENEINGEIEHARIIGNHNTVSANNAMVIGNYRNANAIALGAFYRPNEDTMFSAGVALGNGENMFNAGVSVKLGQQNGVSTSKVAMAKEIKDLQMAVRALQEQNKMLMEQGFGGSRGVIRDINFPDVPENHWAYNYVKSLADRGLLEGYPDGEFKGDRQMTRYEFAAIIYRALENSATADANMGRAMDEFAPEIASIQAADRFRIDRIKGNDNDRNKIERIRVNKEDNVEKNDYRDVYGSHIQPMQEQV